MRVLLADGQSRVRSALRLLLDQHPGIHILGEAMDATGLADWIKAARPDLVLLDWELPGLDAGHHSSLPPRSVPALRELCPGLAVIALSSRPEARLQALAAGADAFVSKGDPPEALLAAINDCGRQHLHGTRQEEPASRGEQEKKGGVL